MDRVAFACPFPIETEVELGAEFALVAEGAEPGAAQWPPAGGKLGLLDQKVNFRQPLTARVGSYSGELLGSYA